MIDLGVTIDSEIAVGDEARHVDGKRIVADGDLGIEIDPTDADAFIPAIDELRSIDQWVAWKYVVRPGAKKPTKPPVNPHNGFGASHSDPKTWASHRKAEARAKRDNLAGVGFVLTDDDEFTGIDLDACRDAETGRIEPWAQAILDLAETYAEVSPSGTGIRIIARGKIDKAVKYDPAHVEIYGSLRYLTITGDHIDGTPIDIREAPQTLAALIARAEAMRPKADQGTHQTFHQKQPFTKQESQKIHVFEGERSTPNFFENVRARAMANLGAWVPALFPRAKFQPGTGAWRVSSKALGRNLQEDIGISPEGAVDFGVADMGDPNQGKRTAIDLVMEWGGAPDATEAARWLCDKLDVTPEALGWQDSAEAERLGEAVAEALESRGAAEPRETIIVDGVTIDAETGEVVEDRPGAESSSERSAFSAPEQPDRSVREQLGGCRQELDRVTRGRRIAAPALSFHSMGENIRPTALEPDRRCPRPAPPAPATTASRSPDCSRFGTS